jgi:hypothetical protein
VSEAKFKFGSKAYHSTHGEVVVLHQSKSDPDWLSYASEGGTIGWAARVELLPPPPPPPPNTVPVRIAVAVNERGDWAADGRSMMPSGTTAAFKARETVERENGGKVRVSFITAHVPLPEKPVEVEGTVEGGGA